MRVKTQLKGFVVMDNDKQQSNDLLRETFVPNNPNTEIMTKLNNLKFNIGHKRHSITNRKCGRDHVHVLSYPWVCIVQVCLYYHLVSLDIKSSSPKMFVS